MTHRLAKKNIKVDENLKKRLHHYAAEQGRSPYEIVEAFLTERLDREQGRPKAMICI